MGMSQCLVSDDKHLVGDGSGITLVNATLTKLKLLEMITSPLVKIWGWPKNKKHSDGSMVLPLLLIRTERGAQSNTNY